MVTEYDRGREDALREVADALTLLLHRPRAPRHWLGGITDALNAVKRLAGEETTS